TVANLMKPGQTIPAGTELGTVGNTGRSSAAHLHYELRTSSGDVLRPVEVHGTTQSMVAPAQSAAFRARVERNRRVLNKGQLVSL
ncbi:MAG: M23 family metallopeptidase, partial [Myxococcota bacterium]